MGDKKLFTMKNKIYDYLLLADRPVKRAELLVSLRITEYKLSDRAMRQMIEEMITQDGYLIRSSEQGYSLIKTEEDLNLSRNYLEQKIEALCVRKNTLLKNWREKYKSEPVNQPLLF